MFGLQNVQPTSRNSAAHLSTKQDDFTSIFSKALILKEILCRSVAKTEKWTTLVHFSDDFVSFDRGRRESPKSRGCRRGAIRGRPAVRSCPPAGNATGQPALRAACRRFRQERGCRRSLLLCARFC